MIRKTVTNFRRNAKTYRKGPRFLKGEIHTEQILRETWWLLFVPIYSCDTIEKTTI